ncbi:MAG TPA: hypothetical protein VFQ25_09570 [Ktedonobacterales bacterium]|nr:hypothetical protein [Ktedonobacterales bacterium]
MVSKIRPDNRQDSDRPHYYSQFWIDVAMGKQSPALPEAPAAAEEDEGDLEAEILAMAPKPEPKPKTPKPAEKKPEVRPTLTSLADLANIDMLMKSSAAMDEDEAPDISAGLGAEAPDISLDVVGGEEEAVSEDAAPFDEGFEEDEEEDEWGGGRRKPKQGKAKRHERRDF